MTVRIAHPADSRRLFHSGTNASSGVSTFVKLSIVQSFGQPTARVAEPSNEASTTHTIGSTKHDADEEQQDVRGPLERGTAR